MSIPEDASKYLKNKAYLPEWDGNGFPPVGCECEFNAYDRGWEKCVVLYVSEYTVLLRTDRASDPEEAFIPEEIELRPIRSEADKKRDEIIEALKEGLGHAHGMYDLMQVYHLLKGGKIPHIRID